MRSAIADHMGRSGYARNNQTGQGLKCEVERIVLEGPGLMISGKVATYAGGAAVAGGLARFLARGQYKTQLLVQDIVGAVFGWCLVVAASVIYPSITNDVWVFGAVSFLAAYVAPALLVVVYHRIGTAEIDINAGPVKIHSNGDEKELP